MVGILIMETIERIWSFLTGALWNALTALWIALTVLAVSLMAVGAGAWMDLFHVVPPKIIMATGPENLGYLKYGQCYREALKDPSNVEAIDSNGSSDSLKK